VVVADHSKFGKVGKTLFAPLAKVDLIITDKSAPRQLSGFSAKVVRV
jgi:DeoR/GlpR family transcriptional regulator of sugar metabolism